MSDVEAPPVTDLREGDIVEISNASAAWQMRTGLRIGAKGRVRWASPKRGMAYVHFEGQQYALTIRKSRLTFLERPEKEPAE